MTAANTGARTAPGQGNEFQLIPTIKMETRHPIEIYFGRDFQALCYHCEVLATPYNTIFEIFF